MEPEQEQEKTNKMKFFNADAKCNSAVKSVKKKFR